MRSYPATASVNPARREAGFQPGAGPDDKKPMLNGFQKARPTGSDGPERPSPELLAHYELEETDSGTVRSGFAVILELTPRRLLVESDVSFVSGQDVHISFFLPNREDGSRVNVALDCVVSQCRDEARLHYSTRISKISEAHREAIANFQAAEDSQ